ncbi:MAG: aminoacyl-tRNA hydrolase [Clostridiales bacterium]|jgi:PTH1 family peptidyl-tRNA hydrolase|nr:aminoacyl-tRNA hydrolase [Clostridiales bacterium]
MLIAVGLGNPGEEYARTFHNAGFLFADALSALLNVRLKDKECKSLTGKFYNGSEKIVIAKPQTYMNLSGDAVRELIGKYGAKESEVMIVYDDADIPLGTLRIRRDGSAGTHNGMRDVILKAGYVPRIRIGIKKDTEKPLRDYVLGGLGADDMKILTESAERAAKAVGDYIYNRDFERIMREYNG